MEKKEWIRSFVISILSAMIISVINYFVWIRQFEATNSQAFYEHKLTAIEKFTKDASNMIFLMRYMDKVHLNIIKLQTKKFLPDTNTKDPFNDIKYKFKSRVTDGGTAEIVVQVGKTYAVQYKHYEEANTFLSQFYSTYWASSNFFNDKTLREMKRMKEMLDPEYYQRDVLCLMKLNTVNIMGVADGSIDTDMLDERGKQLLLVTSAMRDELNIKKNQ